MKLDDLKITRPEPVIWVRRLVIYAALNQPPIQDVVLHRGLNIVWSRDFAEEEETDAPVGHGAGKSTFCRLLRFCLGDTTFGTSEQQKRIQEHFRDGYVGAEVIVEAQTWSVLRPFNRRKRDVARAIDSLQALIDDLPEEKTFSGYLEALDEAVCQPLASREVPGEAEPLSWRHILAWCARDQHERYRDFLTWRSGESGSDMSCVPSTKEGRSLLIRTILGLTGDNEAEIRRDIDRIDCELKDTEAKMSSRKQELAFWRKEHDRRLHELLKLTKAPEVQDSGLFVENLKKEVASRSEAWKSQIQDIEGEIHELDPQIAMHAGQIYNLERDLKYNEANLNGKQGTDRGLNSDLEEKRNRYEKLREQASRPTESCYHLPTQPLATCQLIQDHLANAPKEMATDSHRIEKHEALTEDEKQILRDRIRDIKSLLQGHREKRDQMLDTRRKLERDGTRIQAQFDSAQEHLNRWLELSKSLDDASQDADLADLAEEQSRLEDEKKQARLQLKEAEGQSDQTLRELENIFCGVVSSCLGKHFKAQIAFRDQQLTFDAFSKHSTGGEAIPSFVVFAADIACVLAGSTGIGVHPGIIIQDSPRVADMSSRLYGPYLRTLASFAEKFQGCFQCILTTSTEPPEQLRGKEYVVLELDIAKEEDLLLRKQLGLTEEQQSLFAEST